LVFDYVTRVSKKQKNGFIMETTTIYRGRELNTSAEQLAISAIIKDYPNGQIKQIRAYHTADFTDTEDIPGGVLMIHPLNAKVHVDSLPLNAFTYLSIVPVLGEHTDAEFKNSEDRIHEACPQFSNKPPSLRCQAVDTALDGKTWNAELGEDENAFAGVFKQTRGRDTRYFIAVQAGAPMAARQMRDRLLKKDLTFEQLLSDKDYNYAQYLSQRNCERLAYNMARALKVPIRSMTDMGSHVEHEYSAKPKRAVPLYTQAISTIAPVIDEGRKAVGVFSKLTPVSGKATPLQFVYEGPYMGIAVFNMAGSKGKGYALPSHSGKHANGKPLPAAEVDKRCRDVIVEGVDVRAHPDVVSDNYNEADSDEFLAAMQELGWKQQKTMNNLVPVVVKVFDPSVHRK
jgi:hypothetical protein